MTYEDHVEAYRQFASEVQASEPIQPGMLRYFKNQQYLGIKDVNASITNIIFLLALETVVAIFIPTFALKVLLMAVMYYTSHKLYQYGKLLNAWTDTLNSAKLER